ncbi:hypothetical protein ACH5RR_012894 [Cinchona calisaya]|uniref:Uncharacterized protein n=1 Tax=Cinchona calisaya TaxID=153742 RepID=A0ABD3A9K7_9GENT
MDSKHLVNVIHLSLIEVIGISSSTWKRMQYVKHMVELLIFFKVRKSDTSFWFDCDMRTDYDSLIEDLILNPTWKGNTWDYDLVAKSFPTFDARWLRNKVLHLKADQDVFPWKKELFLLLLQSLQQLRKSEVGA